MSGRHSSRTPSAVSPIVVGDSAAAAAAAAGASTPTRPARSATAASANSSSLDNNTAVAASNSNSASNIICEMGALLPFGRPTVAEDGSTMMLDTSSAAGAMLSSAASLSDVPFLSVPDDLLCAICLCAASEPVVTEECGHLFCRACILTALERKSQCPIDRNPLTAAEVRKDVRTQRKIASLRTRCPNHAEGCAWVGELSDMQGHCDNCEFSVFKCGFVMVGCDADVTRKSVLEHSKSHLNHHLALLCRTAARLSEENTALRQELDLMQRDTHRFTWVVTMFSARRGPFYSRKFFARGLQWYLGVDFEGPDHHAGVYVFAEGHTKRVDFKLVLLNQDPRKDRIHIVNDWAVDYKGKGWGPLKFIDRTILGNSGFLVSGSVRIQVEMTSEPYD